MHHVRPLAARLHLGAGGKIFQDIPHVILLQHPSRSPPREPESQSIYIYTYIYLYIYVYIYMYVYKKTGGKDLSSAAKERQRGREHLVED